MLDDPQPWPLACPPPLHWDYVCLECATRLGDPNEERTAFFVLAALHVQGYRYCEVCGEDIRGAEVVERMSHEIGRWVCQTCRDRLSFGLLLAPIIHSIIHQRGLLSLAPSDDVCAGAGLALAASDACLFDSIGSTMLRLSVKSDD